MFHCITHFCDLFSLLLSLLIYTKRSVTLKRYIFHVYFITHYYSKKHKKKKMEKGMTMNNSIRNIFEEKKHIVHTRVIPGV